MTSHDTFVKILRNNSYSATGARRAVFAALQGQEPLTMHELVARVPQADRASVYRSVALFERLGIVQRLQTGWKYKLELAGNFHDHHHHATCTVCGRSFIIPENRMLEETLRELARQIKFTPEHHQLELSGICAGCGANKRL